MPTYKYYPTLSSVISLDDFPESLGFIKDGIESVFSRIFIKDFQAYIGPKGDSGFYSLSIVAKDRLKFTIPGTGISLVLNSDAQDNFISSFPVTVEYEWLILSFIKSFELNNFSYSAKEFYEIGLNILNISEESLLIAALNILVVTPGDKSPIQKLVQDINSALNLNISEPIGQDKYNELLQDIIVTYGFDLSEAIFETYFKNMDLQNMLNSVKSFFKSFLPEDIESYIKNIITPKARVTLALSAGLEFPRNILQPVYSEDGTNPYGGTAGTPYEVIPSLGNIQDPEAPKVMLRFAEALFHLDTQQGLGYNMDLALSTSTPAQIGNTGLIIDIDNLKIDLSTETNIQEADAEGRPADFVGVYAEELDIILPKKWFKKEDGQTLKISGKRLLMGTGGVSGTIALQTQNNTPTDIDDFFWFRIGGDNGFRIGFNKFDVTLQQNQVVGSEIIAALEINKFKYPIGHPNENNTVRIEIKGSIEEDGGFNLTGTVQDYPIRFPGVFEYTLKSAEIGRDSDNDPFYLGTSGKIKFLGILDTMIGPVEIDRLRIYTDGSIELEGGSVNLAQPIKLPLGPVDITVTAIHFGSHQKEVDSQMRKFNFFGFDGGLKVDPLGVEIRGDGVKFYYCTDNKDPYIQPYLHIQTLYLDLIIPANDPVAVINGWLSIPEPGTSPVYEGGITFKLPQAKISGSADMALQPKYPAFIIDAQVDLPAPIPLGSFAIYGFRGLLGYRYVADKEAIGAQTWYDYYKMPTKGINTRKFTGPNQTTQATDPFSIGAGASLGTSFDNGTVMNIRAMLLLSIPSVFMIDGRAAIISPRLGLDDSGEPPFSAMAAIGQNSFELGFGADFKMPKTTGSIIKLYADVQAAFFFNDSSRWYINIGTKQNPNRADILELVSIKSYLMLSAKGIEAGARGEFDFRRTYAGIIKVHAWAYIEIGGKISFEKPQFGAYLDAGIGAELKIKCVNLSASFQILFAVESSKPFLIYGKVRIKVKIKIAWVFKFSFNAEVEVLWEKSKEVNRDKINPLVSNGSQAVLQNAVKGINMLSNETFDLHYIEGMPSGLPPQILQKILPLDTYIDIKTEKGLLPGSIASVIGGYNNPPSRYTDLVPPDKVVKGKELRQVKHKYSIEKLMVMAWNPQSGSWNDYHPHEALYTSNDPAVNTLKKGQFQKVDGQYNTVRLLATTPFSYTEQGEPGWYIPEQYGLTSGSIFCEADRLVPVCANFLNKPLNQQYFCYDSNHMFYANEAAFLLVDKEDEEFAYVSNHPNIFNFSQSLAFNINNKLQIQLPEPSVLVNLKLTSDSMGVRIKYYAPKQNDTALEVEYGNPNPAALNQNAPYTVTVTAANLNQVVAYDKPGWRAITKIIIEPVQSLRSLYFQAELQLANILHLNVRSQLGLNPGIIQSVLPLQNQLAYLDNTNGTLEDKSYDFDVNNFTYRVSSDRDSKWASSWDRKSNQRPKDSELGFTVDGNTIIIDSEYQLTDIKLSPEISDKIYSVKNEGFRAYIIADDIRKVISPIGYIPIQLEIYTNCKINYRICKLQRDLATIKASCLINPAIVKEENLKALNGCLSKFMDAFNTYINTYPDYEFDGIYQNELNAINNFLTRSGTVESYELAYEAVIRILNDLSLRGNCDCKKGCKKNDELCMLYSSIQDLLNTCITNPAVTSEKEYSNIIACIESLLNQLYDFDKSYPSYEIMKDFEQQLATIYLFLNNKQKAAYAAAYSAIAYIAGHIMIEGNCDCGKALQAIKDLHGDIKEIFDGYLNNAGNIKNFDDYIKYVQQILDLINDFHIQYPGLDIPGNLQQQIDWLNDFLTNPNQDTFDQAVIGVGEILDYLNQLGNFQISKLPKTTLLHEVCWLSLESYQYNENIPSQEAISEDAKATVDGIEKYIQPVWRPNTSYLIHLELRDTVDDTVTGEPFKFSYGFTTAGPIGYFHKHVHANYGSPNPDNYPLTSLRRYIDYERSYPNADGNLLSAKPLFYNDITTQIYLYFAKAYAIHMFGSWPAYKGNTAISGRLKIVIKDPVEGTEIINPPHLDYDENDITTVHIPQAVETWRDDEHPLFNNAVNQWINLYNSNNCIQIGADPIKPASKYMSIALKHLKPQKLYTAIVNNLYAVEADSQFTGQGKTEEVHRFVFQTSRYANFEQQVQSYKLSEVIDGVTVNRDAVYTVQKEFTAQQVDNAYKTITGQSNPADSLIINYQHAYDRVFEGILGFSPFEAAISTEFTVVRNAADGNKIIGVIIRNPEPFNIPKIPLQQIQDTVHVLMDGQPDGNYKVLHSKDYSQVIIMHTSQQITAATVDIQFKYKIWDGFSYVVSGLLQNVQISLV